MTGSSTMVRYTRSANKQPPRHLGTRYSEDGLFLPEPGNTVVCHLVAESPSWRAVVEARESIRNLPGAERLAFTPVSSLHMTLFQGVIEFRRVWPYWPEGVSLDAPIDDVTRLYMDRLRNFSAGPSFSVTPTGLTPTGLAVEGCTPADRQVLATWRDRLAHCFGYRHPDHDDYAFHITFAYLTDWFEDDITQTWNEGLEEALERLKKRAPVLELSQPAFCTFNDMRHFEAVKVIGQ